ncbi:MAG: hypothetical protein JWN79_2492 [Gemmatimonadetes bacterium]|jgi:nitrogen-specific signal transduction histidine kinase|nr:hypothetical protein [Gemmatimonadota bacterium]
MSENYSEGTGEAVGTDATVRDAEWRALLVRLLPGVDVDLLLRALRDEQARAATPEAREAMTARLRESDLSPAERELYRVRMALALGSSARMLQHSINNPLGALMAEAQLLELEPLADEHHVAAGRIVELARRIAGVVRGLDAGQGSQG